MRAVTFGENGRLHEAEVTDPKAGPGQVVVRVAACGICGSDLHMVEAGMMTPGAIMGHEASGVVHEVGDGVEGVSSGQPVAIWPLDPCGECSACKAGASGRCETSTVTTLGLGPRPGAFAELVSLSAQMVRPLASSVPVELGALAEPAAVALRGIRRSRFEPGMSVGVIGCGPIGLCAVLVAKALGASRVWAADTNPFRSELAVRAGADAASATPEMADVVVECAGATGTLQAAVGAAHPGGQVVLLAVNMKEDAVHPFIWTVKEVEVVPSIAHNVREFDEATELIASGALDPAPIITRRVSFEEADEAFFGLLAGAAEGKVLVTP